MGVAQCGGIGFEGRFRALAPGAGLFGSLRSWSDTQVKGAGLGNLPERATGAWIAIGFSEKGSSREACMDHATAIDRGVAIPLRPPILDYLVVIMRA